MNKSRREHYLANLHHRQRLAKFQARLDGLDRTSTFIRFVVNPAVAVGAGLAFGLIHHDLARVVAGAILALVVLFEATVWRFRRPRRASVSGARRHSL